MYSIVTIYVLQTQQQIAVQGQQVAQTAEGQTIVYQPVNADGTILQQGKCARVFLQDLGGIFFILWANDCPTNFVVTCTQHIFEQHKLFLSLR